MPATSLKEALGSLAVEGEVYERLEGGKVRCWACGHRCMIADGRDGICHVRFNRGGTLYVPDGYVGALQVDPIEKKPFFHVLPGAEALSFGMLGCDYHCAYCQNWITSQALRDPEAVAPVHPATPEQLVAQAVRHGAPVVVSTYNEPLITSEWAARVFRVARARGLLTGYVSNGNGTPQVLDYLEPLVDLYKVDLKSLEDRSYRRLGGVLKNVLETIASLVERGLWVEIVTLLVPGFNDSDRELGRIAAFLAEVSPDLPWHVTAFHPDYKMTEPRGAVADDLLRAYEIGKEAGLHFVYAGNHPGQVGNHEDTFCPDCGASLVERTGFHVRAVRITPTGQCPGCARSIPGLWSVERALARHKEKV